jgi:K+-sensing histidine kinase KdpD
MKRVQANRDAIAMFAGLSLPVAVAAALAPFRATFASTASALILVAVVVGVAVLGNRSAGFIAAASASVWFDFFLTRPYERFEITHRPDVETTICLIIVGVAVTELAARGRHHRIVAIEESDYVDSIYRLSELVASGAPVDQVLSLARDCLIEVLHLRDCRYVPSYAGLPEAELAHDGLVYFGAARWGAESMGLPSSELELVVRERGQILGRFLLGATPGVPVSVQRRLVAVAIADQVGGALAPYLRPTG